MKYYFDSEERVQKLRAAAEQWKGTPFHAHACVQGAGVDCVQLVAAVYNGAGIVHDFKPPQYSMDGGAHLHASQVIEYVERCGRFEKLELSSPELMPGDLICLRVYAIAHHVGIFLGDGKFIQAFQRYGVRILPLRDSTWKNRLTALYRPIE